MVPGVIAKLACELEANARKPGNVHPERSFKDLTYQDLLDSAAAIAPVMDDAARRGVGQTIFDAVTATRRAVDSNANLGIILLFAPLCAAAPTVSPAGVRRVLDELTVLDATLAYRAIRLAQPGGMGHVSDNDVNGEPTMTLLAVMRTAAERDTVARQYANGCADVFHVGVPALVEASQAGATLEEAIIWCHLTWMAHFPDTLIARKRGIEEARQSADMARRVLQQIGRPDAIPNAGLPSHPQVLALDQWLTALGNRRNPGTSADLVAASLYVAIAGQQIVPASAPER